MKWILVTTNPAPHLPGTNHPHGAGWNVGDCFARLGVEQIVREVDPEAVFGIVNMDDARSITTPQPFDRAIFAGRPMFWKGCETHPLWTELLNGWLCKEPRKVLALGVGDCFALPTPEAELLRLYELARRRVYELTVRSRTRAPFGACPATWVLLDRPEVPTLKLSNLMKRGAHYPDFDLPAAAAWEAKLVSTAAMLRAADFYFVAHTLEEARLAAELGWSSARILLATTISSYLAIYSRALVYYGNRIHGALVLASRPATAVAVGLDSRIFAPAACHLPITFAGLQPRIPDPESGDAMASRIAFIREQRAAARELVRSFAL